MIKKLLSVIFCIVSGYGFSQTNTFPNSGNVGVGTSSPQTKLHIYKGNSGGSIHYMSDIVIEDNDNGMINILTPDTKNGYYGFADQDDNFVGGIQYNHPNDEMYFRVNNHGGNNADMVIKKNGFIGIGTTTPEYRLHVSTGVRFRRTAISTISASAENSWVRDTWLTGNNNPPKWNQSTARWERSSGVYNDIGGIMWQDEGTYFIREKAGTQTEYTNSELLNKAFLFSDMFTGNIGIGTNNPGSWKLAVNGKIRAKEIKVDTDWSDFVFEETYTLPSLEDVEQHIKEKGHLKDIPSAKEVEENGIYLGEMDAKLLQKIEELTLYTIAQQKMIKEQQELLKQQEKNFAKIIAGLKEEIDTIKNKK
ncbi:hypothetical protein OOZ15_10400 [Galbibacter sp. EGI 63066]|uniref:hypothetical protein n=1 Tax=Galbibacter sp. EGI 63066 TaxID=2993559 RepID=UPI002249355C|nr:hypothetical protein [Galbibacter sp. EGI 63066]MCX2680351.1 hypothetical protein [Galbibacter sp. EGI 63066]